MKDCNECDYDHKKELQKKDKRIAELEAMVEKARSFINNTGYTADKIMRPHLHL